MSPEDALEALTEYSKQINLAAKKYVAVGIPLESIGSKAYKNGAQVIQVAASHEYGEDGKRRSFLREPFSIKSDVINNRIDSEFKAIFNADIDTDKALGRIGIEAVNISKGAFTTGGYGTWHDITEETKAAKGSSKILVDTSILRTSITFAVRG